MAAKIQVIEDCEGLALDRESDYAKEARKYTPFDKRAQQDNDISYIV